MLNPNQTTIGARAQSFIARHPLIGFLALAYAFSWTLWFVDPQHNVGAFGPAVAAVLISGRLAPQKVAISRPQHAVIFTLTFVIALSVWIVFRAGMNMDPAWIQGVVSACFISVLSLGPISSNRGVLDLLRPLATWRVGLRWYAVALLLGPAMMLLGVGVDEALGGRLPPPTALGQAPVGLAIIGAAYILLFGSGFTEEPGWRGFALPRLQRRISPLVASLLVGSLWAFWHAPLYFNGFYTANSGTGPAGIIGLLSRFVWVIPLAILFTWVYNHTRGSLLIAVLFHASFNISSVLIPLSARAGLVGLVGLMWVVAMVVTVADQMWRQPQPALPIAPLQPKWAARYTSRGHKLRFFKPLKAQGEQRI